MAVDREELHRSWRVGRLALAVGAVLLTDCEHERELRSRSWGAPSHVAPSVGAPVGAPVAQVLRDDPCANERMLDRWRSAASIEQLCELLPRVRAEYFVTRQSPTWGIPNAVRVTMRQVVEKCRAELRFSGPLMDFYSTYDFRLLITTSGSIVLGSTRPESPRTPFRDCVLRWVGRRSSPRAAGDLLEVTVPPRGYRWWLHTQTPWLTQGLVW